MTRAISGIGGVSEPARFILGSGRVTGAGAVGAGVGR